MGNREKMMKTTISKGARRQMLKKPVEQSRQFDRKVSVIKYEVYIRI